jgi:hypothetical protein
MMKIIIDHEFQTRLSKLHILLLLIQSNVNLWLLSRQYPASSSQPQNPENPLTKMGRVLKTGLNIAGSRSLLKPVVALERCLAGTKIERTPMLVTNPRVVLSNLEGPLLEDDFLDSERRV